MRTLLPPLQFAVLSLIDKQTPGHIVREQLKRRFKVSRSGPAFYQLMARLEADALVKGEYRYSLDNGQPIKERVYTLTAKGTRCREATRRFYSAVF